MRIIQSTFIAFVLCALCFAGTGLSQGIHRPNGATGRIDAGTALMVRTNERVNTATSDGRVYSGVVEQDVRDRNGNIAIPRGSDVELLVKKVSANDLALDLDSVTINGERYGVSTDENIVHSDQNNELGANRRTGEYVGGGAVLGAIIGAIAGGGKGAAIGAGAGAAAGAGAQILTRGNHVTVPAESLLTFRLSQPLRAGITDRGYAQNGVHYHSGYGSTAGQSQAYRDGLQAGRSDFDRNVPLNSHTRRWSRSEDLRDYEAGYRDGYQYQGASNGTYSNSRQKPGYYNSSNARISIGTDNNISWQAPENANIYVQMDNEAPKLFASGRSGAQSAPWITRGHLYTFILMDPNGNELARDQRDLRNRSQNR